MHGIAVALLIAAAPSASFLEILAAGLRGGQQGLAQSQYRPNPYATRYPYAPRQVYAPAYVASPVVQVGCFTDAACGPGAVCIMVGGLGQCVKRVNY